MEFILSLCANDPTIGYSRWPKGSCGGGRKQQGGPERAKRFFLGESNMAFLAALKHRARHLKAETYALYLAARDPRTPWYAKLLVASIVAYALSPVDLIPDFVPVLGYLDDLILIPMGIALAIRLIPHPVLEACRKQANETMQNGEPVSRAAGAIIGAIWGSLAALCALWAYEAFMVRS